MKTFKNCALFFIMIHIAVYAFPRESLKKGDNMERNKKLYTYKVVVYESIEAYSEDEADVELNNKLDNSIFRNDHLSTQLITEELL